MYCAVHDDRRIAGRSRPVLTARVIDTYRRSLAGDDDIGIGAAEAQRSSYLARTEGFGAPLISMGTATFSCAVRDGIK